jgi:hypothetical protein
MVDRIRTAIVKKPADYEHLLAHAQARFPQSKIEVSYTEGEIIHIDVDGRRFTFAIGSDDDAYIFDDGVIAFSIPLFLDPSWD